MNTKQKKILAIGASCVAVAVVAGSLMGMAPGGGGGGMGGGPGGRGGSDEDANTKTVVETATPTMGTIVVSGSFVGSVEPGQQVTVYPKVSGEVLSVNFQVGDTVEAGDVLLKIDSTSLEYTIAQTQANISSSAAKAQLNLEIAQQDLQNYTSNTEEGLNSTLLQAEASVLSAENAVLVANNNYRVARQNYNDFISGDSEDDYSDTQAASLRSSKVNAELQLESAQQSLESARASLEAVKKQVEEQKASAENSVKSAELNTNMSADYISLQSLQSTLSDYTVTSPIGGVVEQRGVDAYDMASAQTAAFVISNKDLVTVSFNVAETALDYMRPGDSITLAKDDMTATGIISEVSSMVDSGSGLYTVKATVESAPFELRSGSTVKLYADTQKVENEMMIPIDAVYYESGKPYVYVFENNTAVRKDIETGISDDDNIQVKSGLEMTDEVIVTWSSSLMDGAEVYLPGTVPEDTGEDEEGAEAGRPAPDGDAIPPAEDGPEPEAPAGDDSGEIREEGGDETPRDDAEEDLA